MRGLSYSGVSVRDLKRVSSVDLYQCKTVIGVTYSRIMVKTAPPTEQEYASQLSECTMIKVHANQDALQDYKVKFDSTRTKHKDFSSWVYERTRVNTIAQQTWAWSLSQTASCDRTRVALYPVFSFCVRRLPFAFFWGRIRTLCPWP